MAGQPESNPSVEERVDRLNEEAWEVRVSDSLRAHALSGEAVALARQASYRKGLAEGLRTLGFSYIRLSQHDEALEALGESLELFREMGDEGGQGSVFEYLGIVHRSLSEYERSLEYLRKSLELRERMGDAEGMSLSLYHTGVTYRYIGDYARSLDYLERGLGAARRTPAGMGESYILNMIGSVYIETGDYQDALERFQESLRIRREIGDKWGEAGCLDNIGSVYLRLGRHEEALEHCLQGLEIAESVGDKKGTGNTLFNLARISFAMGDHAAALRDARESLDIRRSIGDRKGEGEVLLLLGELYRDTSFAEHDLEQSLNYLTQALKVEETSGARDVALSVHRALSETLKQSKNFEEALRHFEAYHALEKEVKSDEVNRRIMSLRSSHELEAAQKEAEIQRLRNVELAQLVEEVNAHRDQIQRQKDEIEKALAHLEATQAQLIHREKMASLGELTAGIAHEIKNPLNFVNNFAQLSLELLDELREELADDAGADAREVIDDVEQNVGKILEHGRRADAIVRSMLEHSRGSGGQREATDLNRLLDDHLNLAYHGMRAQRPGFQCEVERDLDDRVETAEVVPQEIGRVFLNLLSNAFYATYERQQSSDIDGYTPAVSVSTARRGSHAEIRIRDNGAGIPQKVRQRIFEPFFTTKPTGAGTGLGLSISHDIIVKGHGGALEVASEEGAFTEFTITLPV